MCFLQSFTYLQTSFVKIVDGGLHFYFFFSLYFIFLFLEQLRLGLVCHAVTSVTSWWCSHKTDHETWENGVEGSGTKWLSGSLKVDLIFISPFHFYFILFFIFDLFSIIRTRVRARVTKACCHTAGHIRWHGHKLHDIWKNVEDSGRMMSYNVWNTCWPWGIYMVV